MATPTRVTSASLGIAGIVLLCAASVGAGTAAVPQRDAAQRAIPEPVRRAALVASVGNAATSSAGSGSAGSVAGVGGPTIRELVGQRFVVAMRGTAPSPSLLGRVRRGEIGGVILFGGNIAGAAQLRGLVSRLQRTARSANRPPLLIAVDQEGGTIRRVPWAGPVQSTAELGRRSSDSIRLQAEAAGAELRRVGVNVDLAPVGDVPRAGSFMALEQRTFATSPTVVAAAAAAFSEGMTAARVASAVKHFPGIGRARRNTDRNAVEIQATRPALERTDFVPFRSAIAAGVPIVMISNATYPKLDAKPAPWSTRILSLLRRELGFDGVTITDALEGAAATRGRSLSSVAVLSAQAGVDLLLLTGTESSSAAVFERVARRAGDGRIPISRLEASYRRIVALKETYG